MTLSLCDVAIGWSKPKFPREGEDFVELEVDGGAGFLCDLVFNGEIEVVSAVEQAFEGTLILGEDRGADARDVVEVNAAES